MADDAATPAAAPDDADSGSFEPESHAVEESSVDERAVTDAPVGPPEATGSIGVGATAPRVSHVGLATIVGLVAVVVLTGLTGWLGYRAHLSKAAEEQRQVFLQVGRQGAINLTTLNFEHIDDDVQRILNSSTGRFYDDFQQRSASLSAVVKQVKSKSTGSVTSAGIVEPSTPNEVQVLVAVTVKTEMVGQPQQPPRYWRMRISVQKTGDDTKVSDVAFVP